jgi:hypothetical protein
MDDYPDFCLRGLRKSDINNNSLNSNAFYPDENTASTRLDRGMETSINWEDNETVVELTLHYFPTGYARIARSAIHTVNSLPGVNNSLSYERKPENNNPYHGNIVYKTGLTKSQMRAISTSIILCSICVKITGN